jgi:histidinol-phosphate aminotransferase
LALEALNAADRFAEQTLQLVSERNRLAEVLQSLPQVEQVFPSQANFLLVRFVDAIGTYQKLLSNGIIVRDRSRVSQLEGCLRMTIGTPEENNRLLATLQSLS